VRSANFTFAKQKFHISPQEKYFTQGVALFPRLLLGEAPAAAGDEGTPRKLCSHLLFNNFQLFRKIIFTKKPLCGILIMYFYPIAKLSFTIDFAYNFGRCGFEKQQP